LFFELGILFSKSGYDSCFFSLLCFKVVRLTWELSGANIVELSEKWEDFAWHESSTELGVGFRFY